MSEKVCMFCEHFDFDSIGIGSAYSTMTGGDPYGGMSCRKKHYVEERPYDLEDFRKILLKAETCRDYSPPSLTAKSSS